jgi:HAD superfamily hydrolase (TIGR01509 family)
MRAILFDLDGTLLPMELEKFTKTYFSLLAQKLSPLGYEPKELIDSVWKGTYAMVKNDGTVTNEQRFWQTFNNIMGENSKIDREKFDEFYAVEFNGAKAATQPTPLAKQIVDAARVKADKVILATNPLFPRQGVLTRLGWIGLTEGDFDHITTYENSSYCKPNPKYYGQIMKKFDLTPDECIMFGNDMDEDATAAAGAGIETFLVTDCLINRSGSCHPGPSGSLDDAIEYIKAM